MKSSFFYAPTLQRSLLFVLGTLCSLTLFSQGRPMEFGIVPNTDLQMTVYEADSSAAAVVLCDFARMAVEESSTDITCRIYRHRRIKILNEAGFDKANIAIPYYAENRYQQLGRVKAMIHSPDGTSKKVEKKDFFEEQLSEERKVVKFAFPNVQVGSVIEYEYILIHSNIRHLPDWYFQEDIPVRWNELRFFYPDRTAYTYLFEGFGAMDKREEEGVTYLDGITGSMILKNSSFVMKNSVAMKKEPFITSMSDYKARIRFQLDSYVDGYGVKQQVLSSWKEMVKDLELDYPLFGQQYTRKKFTKKANEQLQPQLAGLSDPTEKAKAIYDFVAVNMEWNGYYHDFATENIADIWEKKKGYSTDINFILLSLLRQNGFEAYPIMISTRSNGKAYEGYPILRQFNHTLVWVDINGTPKILDVPTTTRSWDAPTIPALNNRGVLIKEPEAVWIDIPAPRGEDAFIYEVKLNQEGVLSGQLTTKYSGYNASPERRAYQNDETGKHWVARFEEVGELAMSEPEIQHLDDIEEDFREKITIELPEAAQVVGDFIYFSPIMYSGFKENIFKLEKRYFPVDMAYPIGEQIVMKIEIPEGYAIEELPEAANLALAGGAAKFRFSVRKKDERNIQLVSSVKINKTKFLPAEYPGLRELYDLIAEKYGEQIVLKRIAD